MQKYSCNNLTSFLGSWQNNAAYFEMLSILAQLSKLFSESDIPYLDYRLAENLFCKYYNALNDARSCTAYDARIMQVGIGIKTFVLKGRYEDYSVEKVAEFNRLKKELDGLKGKELAKQIAIFRNNRIDFANNQYNVSESQYHIVGRIKGGLRLFNTPYPHINVDKIHLDKDDDTSCAFNDEVNEYTFNKSKSVLLKKFSVPSDFKDIDIDIVEDPFALLEGFFSSNKNLIINAEKLKKGVDYVVLPLYSYTKGKGYYVAERSGLNQFNAGGRARNDLEVYIPVPKAIHNNYPDFFPSRDIPFSLVLPDGNVIAAKICQDGGKALMSNPNKDLGEWLLKKVLKKKPWELVTMKDLDELGFDSVCVEDLHKIYAEGRKMFKIFFSNNLENYQEFNASANRTL